MKILVLAALMAALAVTPVLAAEHDHAGHGMNYLGNKSPAMAHQEVVDGVKATFTVQTMKDAMKAMGMEALASFFASP